MEVDFLYFFPHYFYSSEQSDQAVCHATEVKNKCKENLNIAQYHLFACLLM